jgi:lipoyl(octanoyl) transferase
LAPQQLGSFEELASLQDYQEDRRVALHDWSSSDTIPFVTAWEHQKTLVNAHLERLSAETEDSQFIVSETHKQGVDRILFLQHDPVYTLGTASDPSFIHSSESHVPVVRMDRGGEVTYHGPGQLVVYPILDLRGYNQDIHWYMRALEEAVLRALDGVGLPQASRQDDVTGVWLDNKKVAAVGIKARRWVTMHGLAVNVEETSLENFQGIVPCGLEGRKVACLNEFLDQPLTVAEFAHHMKDALEHVFRVRLVPSDKEISL